MVGSWQPEGGGSRGFYAGDKWISLEHPNATTSYATGINDAGEVVGTWDSADGREHGYTWRDGTFASFDVPGASGTLPDAINSRGHIVGPSVMADGRVLGFYKTGSNYRTVADPSARTVIRGVNVHGDVVGPFQREGRTLGFLLKLGGG